MSDDVTAKKDSILNSMKMLVNVPEEDTVFDPELIIHINSTFATLHQLGVGPEEPFFIESSNEVWTDFIEGRSNINSVKTYMGLKLRLLFETPPNSFGIEAIKTQVSEYEVRLNIAQEFG